MCKAHSRISINESAQLLFRALDVLHDRLDRLGVDFNGELNLALVLFLDRSLHVDSFFSVKNRNSYILAYFID